mgnify:CR=1 FL=1
MQDLIKQVKKATVFLGYYKEEKPVFTGTGFFVMVDKYFYLVTAKHVVNGLQGKDILIFLNSKKGKIITRSLKEIQEKYSAQWIYHKDPEVDIAIISFALNMDIDDVKTIPEDLFLDFKNVFELDDVFFLSYQPGVFNQKTIIPVIRKGCVSLKQDNKTILIDGSAFPGNSGSPVFLTPMPSRFKDGGITLGDGGLGGKFVGIVGSYLPYQEVAISQQTSRPRVIFEENTGLSTIWSVTCLEEIINSEVFQKQLDRLKNKISVPLST